MVSKVITFVPQPDPSLSPTAMDTLGLIGSSPLGKTALNSIGGPRMNEAVRVMMTMPMIRRFERSFECFGHKLFGCWLLDNPIFQRSIWAR